MTENQQAPPERELPQPHEWTDMNEVPEPWRQLQGHRLSLDQVNWIVRRAYETGNFSTGDTHDPIFVPNYGGAREELLDSTEPANGFLVPKRTDA